MGQRIGALAARSWVAPVLLLVMGGLARLTWVWLFAPHSSAYGEIANVAIAFANTGTLADAFNPGEGPTAHVLPIPPIVAGLIYRGFGIRSAVSEGILLALATTTVLASYALLYKIFELMGTPRWGRLLGLAATCLLPLNFGLETVAFRIWEGALGVAVAVAFLLALLKLERTPEIRLPAIAAMSLAAAVVLFVSPAFGVAAYACSLLLLTERLPIRRWPVTIMVAVAGLAIVLAPWLVRNMLVMGEPVLLRSNFGLELAIGNHPAAANTTDDRGAFRARLDEIHPFKRQEGSDAMRRAGGEVAYAKSLGATAEAWIAAHPAAFARLSLKHLGQYFFPPAWQWNAYASGDGRTPSRALGAKLVLQWLIAGAGIAGALLALARAPRRYRLAVMMMLLPALPYMIVQPILRYRYIVFGLSVFFAADLVAYLAARWGSSLWKRSAPARLAGAPS